MKSKKARLTPEQVEFIKDFAPLTQKYNAPNLAKIFGVTKQAIQYHINTKKEESK